MILSPLEVDGEASASVFTEIPSGISEVSAQGGVASQELLQMPDQRSLVGRVSPMPDMVQLLPP